MSEIKFYPDVIMAKIEELLYEEAVNHVENRVYFKKLEDGRTLISIGVHSILGCSHALKLQRALEKAAVKTAFINGADLKVVGKIFHEGIQTWLVKITPGLLEFFKREYGVEDIIIETEKPVSKIFEIDDKRVVELFGKIDVLITIKKGKNKIAFPIEIKFTLGNNIPKEDHEKQLMIYLNMLRSSGYIAPKGYLLYIAPRKNKIVHYFEYEHALSDEEIKDMIIKTLNDENIRFEFCKYCIFKEYCAYYRQ